MDPAIPGIEAKSSRARTKERNAQKLFERQEPREKRRLLNFVLSNCTWEHGEVVANFRQPFDLLAETAVTAAHAAVGDLAREFEKLHAANVLPVIREIQRTGASLHQVAEAMNARGIGTPRGAGGTRNL
jgi:hypothetical protein